MAASFLFCGVLLSACSADKPQHDVRRFAGDTMGTTYHITIVAPAHKPFDFKTKKLKAGVDAELVNINQMMSTYIPDSELMRFNRAPIGQWVTISAPLMDVFKISQAVSKKSGGAFDVTVAPLVDLWGFGPEARRDKVPDAKKLKAAKARVGYQYLELDKNRARRNKDISIDLSAVAKGYGVDWVAEYLQAHHIQNYMVEIGGEVRVKGISPRGGPWRIAIEQPELLHEGSRLALEIDNHAVATSGDYRNYFEVNGKRFSHTINPVTGAPITHNLASVSVVAKSTAWADAWATALDVLGPKKGMALANAEQLPVYMIVKDGKGFRDMRSKTFSTLIP